MLIWKALHVVSMFTMVAGFIGVEVFYAAAIRRREVAAVAFVRQSLGNTGFGPLAFIALLAGIIFGVLTAATGGFDLVGGWLLAAYALLVIFLVNAIGVGEKVVRAGKAAIGAVEGRASAVEVEASLPVGRATFLVIANAVLFAAIVLDMVLKPF